EDAHKKNPHLPLFPVDVLARKVVDEASRFGLTTQSSTDIETLVVLVMAEAAKDADEDLKSMASRLAAIRAVQRCKGDPTCIRDLRATAEIRQADLDAIRDNLDSMSEMGETESLRLQMAMDRLSKFMSTLSNVEKRISSTSQQIVQNLK